MAKGIIYKYPLNIGGTTTLGVPIGSTFLSVKSQNDNVVAYFQLDHEHMNDDKKLAVYGFYVVATGHNFQVYDDMEFIDTLLLYDDKFVLHVYKAKPDIF